MVNSLLMLDPIYSLFSKDIALDLGTANCVIHVKGKGILIREPSVVALNKKTGEILAIGIEAKKMLGKTPATISAIRPLREGVISDFESTSQMISYFIKKVHPVNPGFSFLVHPRIVVGVPSSITEVEQRAVVEACEKAGARKVFLLEEPMAAAVGSGLPVDEPAGSMIVDVGGGTTEIAVISLGGVVVGKSIKLAGDKMDLEIVNYAKEKYGLLLGERMAEEAKVLIGSAASFKDDDKVVTEMRGRDIKSGLPRSVKVAAPEIREALSLSIILIVEAIKDTIEETPPELVADITRKGIVLAGGGSLLRGIDKLVEAETGVPVRVSDNPMDAVTRGCAKALDDEKLLDRIRLH